MRIRLAILPAILTLGMAGSALTGVTAAAAATVAPMMHYHGHKTVTVAPMMHYHGHKTVTVAPMMHYHG
jgi:hypothetical protein